MPKPPRWTREEWDVANVALWMRCGGACWWCLRPLENSADRHHRQRKRDGGDSYANVILLHPRCHNMGHGSVHGNPDEAKERGFIVPPWSDAVTAPIFARNNWWLLDLTGGMAQTHSPDAAAPL